MKIAKLIAKIVGYTLGGIVGLVVILLLAVNFLLQSSAFTGFVLDKVLPGVEESLGADIEVGKLEVSLFPVGVLIEDVYFTPAKGDFKRKFAELKKLEITTSFMPLLKGEVVVDRVLIEGVSNYLYFDENGLANLPIPPSEDEEEEPSTGPPDLTLPILVKDVTIRDTAFYMDMNTDPATPEPETEVAIRSIGLAANADFHTGATHAELRIADGFFRAGTIQDTLDALDLDADFSMKEWKAEVTKLAVRLPDVAIDATATATDVLGDLKAVADVNGTVGLKKVNTLFLPEPALEGTLRLAVHAEAPLPDYSAEGTVSIDGGRVNQLALDELALAFAVDPDKATVKELIVRTAGGRVKVAADLGLKDEMPLSAVVNIDTLNVAQALAGYGMGDLGVAGVVTGDVKADGRLGNEAKPMAIDAGVNLGVAGVAYQDLVRIPKVGLALNAAYTPTGVDIAKLNVTTARTTIQANGKIGLPDVTMGLNLLVKADDLSEFSPIMGKPIAGRVHVQSKVSGSASSPNVDAGIDINDIKFDTFGVDRVNGKVEMAGKKLVVKNMTIRNKAAVVELAADVNLAGAKPIVHAKVNIPPAQIGDFLDIAGMKDLDVAGNIGLVVQVSGPADKLSGTTELKLDEIKAYGENVKDITLSAALADGGVVIKNLSIVKLAPPRPDYTQRADKVAQAPQDQWKEVRIHATGAFDPATGKVALELDGDGLNEMASDVLRKQKVPLIADIDLSAKASGTIANPEAKVRIAITGARFNDMVLGDNVIVVDLANQKAHVTGSLLANREKVAMTATMPTVENEWTIRRFNSKADPEALEKTPVESASVESAEDVLDNPEDFTVPPAETTTASAQPLGDIKLDLTAQLDGPQAVKGQVRFDRFDYSGFLGSLRTEKKADKKRRKGEEEEQEIVAGRLNGVIDVDGSLAAADQIRVAANLDELYFQKNKFILRNQDDAGTVRPLLVTYRGGQIEIENFRLGGSGVSLDVNQGGGVIAVAMRADLATAQEFSDAMAEAKGVLALDATIPESLDATQARALVSLDDASIALQGIPTPIEKLNLRVKYEGDRVLIDRLDARIGNGTMTGGGDIRMPDPAVEDDIMRMRVFVKLADVRTGVDPYLETGIDKVDLVVTTIERGPHRGKMDVSGEVVVDKAVVTYPIDVPFLFKQLADFGQQKEAGGAQTYEVKEDTVFFNIALRADGDVGFVSNLAEIETKFDLVLVGSNASPGMKGSVDVVRGWAKVLQNTYDLSNVTIQFYDEQRIFPSFDVNASTEVKGTKIDVNVAGNPLRYKMSLSSDPPKGERDIFFLLATGVDYDEFQAQGSGVSADEAAALAAQSLVGNQLGKLTGSSAFEVGIDSSSGTSRLQVGTELEKDLTMKMYRGLVDQTLGAEVEYDFYRYVAGLGSWSNLAGYEDAPSSGAFGTGIKLKIDFQ